MFTVLRLRLTFLNSIKKSQPVDTNWSADRHFIASFKRDPSRMTASASTFVTSRNADAKYGIFNMKPESFVRAGKHPFCFYGLAWRRCDLVRHCGLCAICVTAPRNREIAEERTTDSDDDRRSIGSQAASQPVVSSVPTTKPTAAHYRANCCNCTSTEANDSRCSKRLDFRINGSLRFKSFCSDESPFDSSTL
jgi:hypothetical protein